MKTILIDMDSTINLFNPHMANWIMTRGYTLSDMIFRTWDLTKWFEGIEKKEANEVIKDIFCTPGFWLQIPVMKDSQRIVEKLNKKFNVMIVTAPYDAAKNCEAEKREWMAKHFSFIRNDQIIMENEKWKVPGDYIIDDKPETIEKFPGITIAFSYSYNEHVQADIRVTNWIQIAHIFRV